VTIKTIEQRIIDHAFEQGWIFPEPPAHRTGKKVAVIGSGPAGLAAAQQLNRAGHLVTVLERDDRIGGLLRYGIPDFKMDRAVLDRRLELLEAEGILFQTNINVGVDVSGEDLLRDYDAVLVCIGALRPRDLNVPGRELSGVYFAMDYLSRQNRVVAGDAVEDTINASGKHVLIIGGGDTGADCYGTAIRQGAASVHQFQIHPELGTEMPELNPWWPQPAHILKLGPAHEEGGERVYGIHTTHLSGENGCVTSLHTVDIERVGKGPNGERRIEAVPGSERTFPADIVLLAIGYNGAEHPVVNTFGLNVDGRGNVTASDDYQTSVQGVFAAGDARRGQSLIVWAIAEGREAARGVDEYLTGKSRLPLTHVVE